MYDDKSKKRQEVEHHVSQKSVLYLQVLTVSIYYNELVYQFISTNYHKHSDE